MAEQRNWLGSLSKMNHIANRINNGMSKCNIHPDEIRIQRAKQRGERK